MFEKARAPTGPGRWQFRWADGRRVTFWIRELADADPINPPHLEIVGADDPRDIIGPGTWPADLAGIDSETGEPVGRWEGRVGDLPARLEA